jgi:zinc transporter ZupT
VEDKTSRRTFFATLGLLFAASTIIFFIWYVMISPNYLRFQHCSMLTISGFTVAASLNNVFTGQAFESKKELCWAIFYFVFGVYMVVCVLTHHV